MFEIKGAFYLNGAPFQIISGAFHYFRTVPQYWRDRLEKLRNMGCNTVETYIPWNFHEPEEGRFLWEGMHDVCRFLELAQELGLYVILRPSPYICAEWEFGGLPAWLLRDKNMRLRCSYEPYQNAVRRYYRELLPKLAPYQIDRGGSVILMQIENEYGYYGNDTAYLEFLRDTMRECGITVPLVTSDGPWCEAVFKSGRVEGALQTGNFGSGAEWQFGEMKRFMGENKPLMCMEFWNGWFDTWGEAHHTTEAQKAAKELEGLLRLGNLNFYMFAGGTNFGFMNGRNGGSKYGDVTSYEYDAPLTEDGRITEKYRLFQETIRRFRNFSEIPLTQDIRRESYGEISCTGKTDLFSVLERISQPVSSAYPLTMEEIGQNYGYIMYRARISDGETVGDICLEGAADRGQGFRNRTPVFTAFYETLGEKFELAKEQIAAGGTVELLCENIGRENFGTGLENQRKGIAGGVKINDHRHFGFAIYPLPLDRKQLEKLDFDGFGKGCAFVNGFPLGRFWEIGPQKRLYLPAPLLRKGGNTILLFETEGKAASSICLKAEPMLDGI